MTKVKNAPILRLTIKLYNYECGSTDRPKYIWREMEMENTYDGTWDFRPGRAGRQALQEKPLIKNYKKLHDHILLYLDRHRHTRCGLLLFFFSLHFIFNCWQRGSHQRKSFPTFYYYLNFCVITARIVVPLSSLYAYAIKYIVFFFCVFCCMVWKVGGGGLPWGLGEWQSLLMTIAGVGFRLTWAPVPPCVSVAV